MEEKTRQMKPERIPVPHNRINRKRKRRNRTVIGVLPASTLRIPRNEEIVEIRNIPDERNVLDEIDVISDEIEKNRMRKSS